MSERIYSSDGLSKTLSANGGGNGANTGLYVVGNVSPSGHHRGDVLGVDGISKTLCACHHKDPIKILDKNSNENKICKSVLAPDRINKRQNGRWMKEDGEPSFTLTATDKHGVYDGYRVRRLTPVECERLQGFPDNWTKYGVDGELISDTQRYKCCGNAVTVNVIEFLIRQMFLKK
jgi:DNA (cytosine-5)-methyltransferase 1